MEQRQEQWDECQNAAKAALTAANGGLESNRELRFSVSEVLRLWRWPSFETWSTWVVLRSRSGRTGEMRLFVRRRRWRLELDAERLHAPMVGIRDGFHVDPTLELAEADVDAEDLESRLAELQSVGLASLAKPNTVVLDGVGMGLSMPLHVLLRWNAAAIPPGWEDLASWVDRQMDWLDSLPALQEEDA